MKWLRRTWKPEDGAPWRECKRESAAALIPGVAPIQCISYSPTMKITIDVPGNLARLRLPPGVHARLHHLLDKQDAGTRLTAAERREAEGLVNLVEFLSLLKLRSKRITKARTAA
jgi:hypothetical protein